jgi:competence protein ComEA
MSLKDFFYYQRGERIAILLLLILIVLTIVMNGVLKKNSEKKILVQNDSLVQEFEHFQRSFEDREIVDPNGNERKINRQFYSEKKSLRDQRSNTDKRLSDSDIDSSFERSFFDNMKLTEGETIFLNESDTADWKKIPGIGSVYASRIVKYRNLLGGFVSVNQLREVYGIDDELFAKIYPYIKTDGKYTKIAVNKLEFKQLLRHPYLNYKQVKVIVDLRRRKGNISSINELALLDEFTAEDIERLNPYLQF